MSLQGLGGFMEVLCASIFSIQYNIGAFFASASPGCSICICTSMESYCKLVARSIA